MMRPTPADVRSSPEYCDDYFKVPGILVGYIDGFELVGLKTSSFHRQRWHSIIQRVVDGARYIHGAGVVSTDCGLTSVVVERSTLQPFRSTSA